MNILTFLNKKRATIHLDYASTTPVAPEILEAMLPYFREEWANPSAIYKSGVRARIAVEKARTSIAHTLKIRPQGVIFTSGGTESNNHALVGIVEKLHAEGRAYEDIEIVTTKIEHPSILEVCDSLARRGVPIRYVDVDNEGSIEVKHLELLLSPRTALVTFAYLNSEIGVVQEVKRITRRIRAYNALHKTDILVHLDASQAPLWLSCAMDMLAVDMMTLDSGKCYGPKGVGVLALRHGVMIAPFMLGGGQEGGLRSGTENVALVVGCSLALVRAQATWRSRSAAVAALRDLMLDTLLTVLPQVLVNGSRTERIANNVNISIPGIDSEFAVITLDKHGIAASTKSACGVSGSQGSHVVRSVTGDDVRAASTVRFTLGESTTKDEVIRAIEVLKNHVETTRTFIDTLPEIEN